MTARNCPTCQQIPPWHPWWPWIFWLLRRGQLTCNLIIQVIGAGSVSVESTDGNYVCRGYCMNSFECGTPATLTAETPPGWYFHGWYGDYSGVQNPLPVIVGAQYILVYAVFSPLPPPLG